MIHVKVVPEIWGGPEQNPLRFLLPSSQGVESGQNEYIWRDAEWSFFLVLRNGYRPSACLEASCLCFSLVSRFTRVSVCVSERVCVSVCAFVNVHACMHVCV